MRLHAKGVGNLAYINGCTFDCLQFEDNVYPVDVLSENSREVAGNKYVTLDIQPGSEITVDGITLTGSCNGNRFLDAYFWDWDVASGKPMVIGAGIYRTYAKGNLALQDITDGGYFTCIEPGGITHLPSYYTDQIAAVIDSPRAGLLVHNKNSRSLDFYTGGEWQPLWRTAVSWVIHTTAENPSMGLILQEVAVVRVHCIVTEAFNGGSDNEITVGYDADPDGFGEAIDVSSTGIKTVTLGTKCGYFGTDVTCEAYYTHGGAEPDTGQAVIIVEYIRVPIEPT